MAFASGRSNFDDIMLQDMPAPQAPRFRDNCFIEQSNELRLAHVERPEDYFKRGAIIWYAALVDTSGRPGVTSTTRMMRPDSSDDDYCSLPRDALLRHGHVNRRFEAEAPEDTGAARRRL